MTKNCIIRRWWDKSHARRGRHPVLTLQLPNFGGADFQQAPPLLRKLGALVEHIEANLLQHWFVGLVLVELANLLE